VLDARIQLADVLLVITEANGPKFRGDLSRIEIAVGLGVATQFKQDRVRDVDEGQILRPRP
jgi:hypothetical protein